MSSVNLLTAAVAGLLSFLSPCVLPLIPGYISFISGVSLQELQAGSDRKILLRTFVSTVWFVLGFSVVFILLGASATAVGRVLLTNLALFGRIAGAVIILFGIHLIGIVRIPFLQYEKKLHVRHRPLTGLGAFLVGAAFAFGWTPCIGPVLAAILAVASVQETVVRGMVLLSVYSLGLGIPFLITSLCGPVFLRLLGRVRWLPRAVEVVSGLLLVGIGLLMLTNRLTLLAQHLTFFNRFSL